MEVSEYVLSAGRAVLDMVEREWQPLSAGELEQRLDQAVEEILEADLMAKLKSQPPPTFYVQLLQSQPHVGPQVLHTAAAASSPPEEETAESQERLDTVDSSAVKVTLIILSSNISDTHVALSLIILEPVVFNACTVNTSAHFMHFIVTTCSESNINQILTLNMTFKLLFLCVKPTMLHF